MSKETKRFGLSAAEYANLMQALRYGAIIVLTVLLTFVVVAGVSRLLGYTPPPPSSSIDQTIEPTVSVPSDNR